MKKIILKKNVAIIIVASMFLSLIGCDAKQESIDTKNMVYEENMLSLDDIEGEIGTIAYKDNRIYFSEYQLNESIEHENDEHMHEGSSEIITKLYSVDMNGKNLKEVPFCIENSNEILYVMVGKDDTLSLVMDYYDEEKQKNFTSLVKIGKDGKELMSVNLSDIISQQENACLNNVVMDSRGQVVVITEQTVYILNDEFEMIGEVKSDNYIIGSAVSKNGEILCATSETFLDADGSMKVCVLDTDNKKWSKKYKIATGFFSGSNCLIDGYEFDFYYKDDSGIYGYNIEGKTTVKLMDYMASYLTCERVDSMISADGGKFLCNIIDLGEEDTGIALYTKVDPTTLQDRIIITYGGIYVDENVKKAALNFNRINKEYQIEFIDYSSDTEDPIAKMNADIIAGNIPDIIDLNYVSVEQYADKGLLVDLSSYVEKDSEICSEDFIESVWKAMHIDNKLYYIASDFGIDTIIGRTKDVGEDAGWTFEELKTVLEEHGKNKKAFYSENKGDLLSLFLRNGLMDFINQETGQCEFNSQEFKNLLKFCNDRGTNKETDYENYRLQMSAFVKEGKQLFVDAPGVTIDEIQIYQEMFDEDITFVGYPDDERTGSYFRFNNQIGISAESEAKDVAWEFVRTFLLKEYQGKIDNIYGTPIRKDCFEMLVKRKTATDEYTDELGQEIYPVSEYWEWDGIGVEGRPLSQQEVNMYINMVNNTTKCCNYDSYIMQIINEETESYFKNDKSLDEVAEVIQNRVQTYVDENR